MAHKPAALAVLDVIDYLAQQRGPVPAANISRALGLPRSSVYELLETMAHRGYAVHFPSQRRWGLGVRAFELASGYQRQQPLVLLGTPLLRRLVAQSDLSAHLAVLHGTDVIYLIEERTRRGPHLVSDVGVRLPAHLTATGRSLLAWLPPPQLRALYPVSKEELPLRTPLGPRSTRELSKVLRDTRARGFSVEDGEVTEGLASIAVAVHDHTGWPIAAVALTGATDTIHQELENWVLAISAVARELSGQHRSDSAR